MLVYPFLLKYTRPGKLGSSSGGAMIAMCVQSIAPITPTNPNFCTNLKEFFDCTIRTETII